MLASIIDIFIPQNVYRHHQHQQQRRRSSLQGCLPVCFSTSCDVQPLSPLTITDPISVPMSYHNHDTFYGSSVDSLSTAKTSSLGSSFGSLTPPSSSSLSLLTLLYEEESSSSSSFSSSLSSTSSSSSSSSISLSSQSSSSQPPSPQPSASLSLSLISNSSVIPVYPVDNQSALSPSSIVKSIPITRAVEIEAIIMTKNVLLETFRHFQSFVLDHPSVTLPLATSSTATTTSPTASIASTASTASTAISNPTKVMLDNESCLESDRHLSYIRSLRENPDHLRMVVAEINMMRANKLISPLRPRAILLERSDPFIPGTPSPLRCSI